jgi:hypothetical protein
LELSDLSLEDRFGLIFEGHSELLKFVVFGSFKGFELSFPSLNFRLQSGGLSFEFGIVLVHGLNLTESLLVFGLDVGIDFTESSSIFFEFDLNEIKIY